MQPLLKIAACTSLALTSCVPAGSSRVRADVTLTASDDRPSLAMVRGLLSDPSNQIFTVEDLLALMPPDLRGSYVLMHESGSNQTASAASPRVIMFEPTRGTFSMTFNGDPEASGYDTVEMWEFDDSKRRFVFQEIRFSFDGAVPRLSAENPGMCRGCHTPQMRPNWEQWNDWPGAFFGHDTQGVVSEERAAVIARDDADVRAFFEKSQTHPRYRHLLRPEAVIAREAQSNGGNAKTFNILLMGRMGDYIARELEEHASYQELKWAFAAAIWGCDGFERFVPAYLRAGWVELSTTAGQAAVSAPYEKLKYLFERSGGSSNAVNNWKMSVNDRDNYKFLSDAGTSHLKIRLQDPDIAKLVNASGMAAQDDPAALQSSLCAALQQHAEQP